MLVAHVSHAQIHKSCMAALRIVSAGLLKTVAANKDAALPLKLFEIGDVIVIDPATETGSRNERHLAAVHCSREAEFEIVHGLLHRIMELVGIPLAGTRPHTSVLFLPRPCRHSFVSFVYLLESAESDTGISWALASQCAESLQTC